MVTNKIVVDQALHMDSNPKALELQDLTGSDKIRSVNGQGYLIFVGISDISFMWIGECSTIFDITPTIVVFKTGDVFGLPYGCIHAGVTNKG